MSSASSNQGGKQFSGTHTCYPTNFDRRLLVWYKKFPDMGSVPREVSVSMMKKVKQKARIHFNLLTMGVFAVLLFGQGVRGHRAREAGLSVTGMNEEWHKKYNETGVMSGIREENTETAVPLSQLPYQ